MSVRSEVQAFVRLGPLVNENAVIADDTVGVLLERQHEALRRIEPPVSFEEAKLLMTAFGPDSDTCFGLAWALLHLIETGPIVLDSEPPPDASWWVQYMWARIENSKRLGMVGPKPSAPPWPPDPNWEPAPGQSVWLLDNNGEKLLRGTIKTQKPELKPGTWWVVHVGARIFRRVTSDLRLDTGDPPPV